MAAARDMSRGPCPGAMARFRSPRFATMAAALAAALSLAWPAAGQTGGTAAPAAQHRPIRTGAELMTAIRALVAQERHAEARALIAVWRPGDPTHRYRVRYVEGLILRAQGDHQAAIDIFRSILAERPEFSFVRLDLTQTLFQARQDDAARYQADLLIAAGLDERIGGGLRSIVGAIDERRPIRFRAFASLLPSSNVNGGTDNTMVIVPGLPPLTIAGASRRKSGIGILLGGEVLFRQGFGDRHALVGSLGAVGRFHPAIDRADLTFSGAAGIERRFARGQITLSAIARQDFADSRDSFREFGARLEASRFVGEAGRVYAALTLTDRTYPGLAGRDGWRAEASGFADRFFGPSRFVRVLAGAVAERAKTDVNSFDEVSAGLGGQTELPAGLTVYAQASVAVRRYRGAMAGFGFAREDLRFEGQAIITKRDLVFKGFAPQLSYSVVRNASNSPFDDHTSHGIDLRLVKQF